jgi:hypothetical protein
LRFDDDMKLERHHCIWESRSGGRGSAFFVRQHDTYKTMNTLKIKKWEGVISVAWALLGYELFRFGVVRYHFESFATFVSAFFLWWGVSLLLAICGLSSGSRVGVIAGSVTLLGLFYVLWIWRFLFLG